MIYFGPSLPSRWMSWVLLFLYSRQARHQLTLSASLSVTALMLSALQEIFHEICITAKEDCYGLHCLHSTGRSLKLAEAQVAL